jgi:hypothetical protein
MIDTETQVNDYTPETMLSITRATKAEIEHDPYYVTF